MYLQDITARRQRKGKPKPSSLWEELAELGEEFIEFLEQELGLTKAEAQAEQQRYSSGGGGGSSNGTSPQEEPWER